MRHLPQYFLLLFKIFKKFSFEGIFIALERGRGTGRQRERERNIYVRETSIGCLPYALRPGIELATFCCTGQCSNHLGHTGQGCHHILNPFYSTWTAALFPVFGCHRESCGPSLGVSSCRQMLQCWAYIYLQLLHPFDELTPLPLKNDLPCFCDRFKSMFCPV